MLNEEGENSINVAYTDRKKWICGKQQVQRRQRGRRKSGRLPTLGQLSESTARIAPPRRPPPSPSILDETLIRLFSRNKKYIYKLFEGSHTLCLRNRATLRAPRTLPKRGPHAPHPPVPTLPTARFIIHKGVPATSRISWALRGFFKVSMVLDVILCLGLHSRSL